MTHGQWLMNGPWWTMTFESQSLRHPVRNSGQAAERNLLGEENSDSKISKHQNSLFGPNWSNGKQFSIFFVVLGPMIPLVCCMNEGKLASIHVNKIMTCLVLCFYWGSLPFKLMLILNFFYYHLFLILKLNLTESNSKLKIKKESENQYYYEGARLEIFAAGNLDRNFISNGHFYES